jgi:two-component system cell cycle response regulator
LTARRLILVVDDDQHLVEGLQDYLESNGYVVYTSSTGVQAYPLASARQPALIILDVDMPIMNGLKALERLRKEPDTKHIPIILMTGMPSGEISPAIQNMPLVSHVKKPVEPEDLLSLVRYYIPEE